MKNRILSVGIFVVLGLGVCQAQYREALTSFAPKTGEMQETKRVLQNPAASLQEENILYLNRPDLSNQEVTPISTGMSKPAKRFLSSLLIPGSGQAQNEQWAKAAGFIAVDVLAIVVAVNRRNSAKSGERRFQEFGDQNFSIIKYANFLVDYNQQFGTSDLTLQDLAQAGITLDVNRLPDNSREEWNMINLDKLRELEDRTRFGGNSGNLLSHDMPDFGSQQYYELMSKYFQFGPGWKDFNGAATPNIWQKNQMSQQWLQHGSIGEQFNDDFRLSQWMINLVVVNHLVSAFDAMLVSRRNISINVKPGPNMQSNTISLNIGF